jgi:hypothetical protein
MTWLEKQASANSEPVVVVRRGDATHKGSSSFGKNFLDEEERGDDDHAGWISCQKV